MMDTAKHFEKCSNLNIAGIQTFLALWAKEAQIFSKGLTCEGESYGSYIYVIRLNSEKV